jgi:uncharacterized protein (TIGR02246 family)
MDLGMLRQSPHHGYVKVAALVAVVACLSMAAAQPILGADDARAEIEARIDALEKLWAAGDAKGVAEQLYTHDVVIAGEGMPAPVQGRQQAEQLVAELIKGSKTVELELKRFRQLGPEAASTWVVWHLPPPEGQADPVLIRSLFVWEKQGGEWRMSDDMFSIGPF